MRSIKRYKKEDEGGREARAGGCIDLADQSRDALGTLAALFFLRVENMSRENQIPGIPSYNLLGDHQTGDASSRRRRKCKKKRDSDIELSSSGRRGQQHRKLEEGNAAAERVVPIFIELQLTLKYFPAKRPCWTGVGRRLAGLWIQDGRPGSSSAVALRGKPAAVTGRRVGARAQPSQAGRQRPTQTPSNITRLSTITDTHLHSFQS